MIPRDLECYYCKQHQHERCALPDTCACYLCYPVPHNPTTCEPCRNWRLP